MRSFSIFLFLLCVSFAEAQKIYSLEIKGPDENKMLKKLNYTKRFGDKKEREKEIQKVLYSLYDNAYLAARVDSMQGDSLSKIVYFTPGERYEWAYIKKGNSDEEILSEAGFREKIYRKRPVYYKDIRILHERILRYCENNGYPFATVSFDSVQISNNSISAVLNVQKNNLVRIDSILIKGKGGISPVYLYNYIGIKPGDLYNESKVKNIASRLRELPFIHETKPFEILFSAKLTRLVLYLEKKRSSQFDGIIGILPDNKTGKVVLTGDVRLKLQNSFGHGELMEVNWRRLQTQTQDLKTHLVLPFLFRTPFGADLNFKLYKKDTSYLEVNPNIGIQYLLNRGNYFKVFVNRKTSTLLSTKGLEFQTVLPAYADVSSTIYGIGFRSERLDYRLNPGKGYSFTITAGAGNKRIIQNPKLNPVAYENIKLSSAQYNADLDLSFFIPFAKRSTVKVGTLAGWVQADNIFRNELFRIGGFKTLRGFDEESIYASSFSILTVEYRYLLETNSYLYFFGDGAWYERNTTTEYVHDTPYGFGSGISFETKAGIFSIGYALGHQFNNPIYLKSGKVHFGIVSYF